MAAAKLTGLAPKLTLFPSENVQGWSAASD
jgi:hypothetical protein